MKYNYKTLEGQNPKDNIILKKQRQIRKLAPVCILFILYVSYLFVYL